MTRTNKATTRDGSRLPATPPGRDWVLATIAGAGVILTAGLAASAWSRAALPFCPVGAGCDIVQGSRWSVLLGLPVAAWGCAVYVALLLVALIPTAARRRWRLTTLLAGVGLAVSLYLTAVGWLELRATCGYCLASLALITIALLLSCRASASGPRGPWRITTALIAGLVVGLLHLHYSGVFDPAAGPDDPYHRALAAHLTAVDAKFYGAYWCPHCQQQKAYFGAAAKFLPYVECSPHGPREPQATSCMAENVKNYPTWVLDGQRYERILSLQQLARLTGFEAPPGPGE